MNNKLNNKTLAEVTPQELTDFLLQKETTYLDETLRLLEDVRMKYSNRKQPTYEQMVFPFPV